MMRVRSQRRGFTLPEVLTSAVVISLIIGTVVQICGSSLRVWYRGTTENMSAQKAAWVIQRMAPDLREGICVTPGTAPFDSSFVAIRLPDKIFDSANSTYANHIEVNGLGEPFLVPGNYAVFYRGDGDGNLDVQGTHIWRRLVSPTGTVLKQYSVADNVIDNPIDPVTGNPKASFHYWPDLYRLKSVEVTVTVQERQASKRSSATANGELTLRNR